MRTYHIYTYLKGLHLAWVVRPVLHYDTPGTQRPGLPLAIPSKQFSIVLLTRWLGVPFPSSGVLSLQFLPNQASPDVPLTVLPPQSPCSAPRKESSSLVVPACSSPCYSIFNHKNEYLNSLGSTYRNKVFQVSFVLCRT